MYLYTRVCMFVCGSFGEPLDGFCEQNECTPLDEDKRHNVLGSYRFCPRSLQSALYVIKYVPDLCHIEGDLVYNHHVIRRYPGPPVERDAA